jgi:hypothetical protein
MLAMSTAVKKRNLVLDRIVVKRPVPSPELLQGAPTQPPTVVNPEFEQKPLAELNLQTSEDFHGGSELTFSMSSQRDRSQQNTGSGGETRQRGRQHEEDTDTTEESGNTRQPSRKKGDGGSQTGVFNAAQAIDVTERAQRSDLRRLQTEFYRILEMLAEEKTKQFDPSMVGSLVKAEYDVKKMALRRYEGKPPTKYKAPRVRESVVLVLDNSGSMVEWANMLRAMTELAAKRRDVEVYLAPNGYVEEQIAPVRRKVKHDEFMKRMSGRKIIYVGDFDGANMPIELSWRNEVIWIAPESRYRRFLSHSWVKYDEAKHKGAFIRAFTIGDIMKSLKKVLGGVKWIDMCKKCGDE